MRKVLVLSGVAIASVALAAAPAFAGVLSKPKPPVTLEGKVNNKGTKTVKKGKVSIEADDFYFDASFLKAKPGSTVTVSLKNEGKAQHTFTIPSLGIDQVLDPDQKATVTVTVPTDGALPFYCRFHGTPPTGGQGMQGAFFSQKGQPVSASAATSSSSPGASPPMTAAATSGGGPGY